MSRHSKPIDRTDTTELPAVPAQLPTATAELPIVDDADSYMPGMRGRGPSLLERMDGHATVRSWLMVMPPLGAIVCALIVAVRGPGPEATVQVVTPTPQVTAAQPKHTAPPAPTRVRKASVPRRTLRPQLPPATPRRTRTARPTPTPTEPTTTPSLRPSPTPTPTGTETTPPPGGPKWSS